MRLDSTAADGQTSARLLLSKVPEVTIYFWIIKILATTVGETAADYLNDNLGLGLSGATYIMGGLLVVALGAQFAADRYIPPVYWVTVVLVSVVGTLITDNLVDNAGVPLTTTSVIFAVALSATFGAWYVSEQTLSIHSIVTRRREAFYWLVVLFTFALGTAAGDLVAEKLNVGYWKSALLFAAVIALVTFAWRALRLDAIVAFWIAYVLTRPLGASIGDYVSQPRVAGGLGLGTAGTSAIFLAVILALVIYLARSRVDVVDAAEIERDLAAPRSADV